jgi:four helix bundle protein
LEERTFQFALAVRHCISGNRWKRAQWPDINQLLRASGAVAAHYGEAHNAAADPDFLHRIRTARKESNESKIWLRLLGATTPGDDPKTTLRTLYREADELTRILATIERNSQ